NLFFLCLHSLQPAKTLDEPLLPLSTLLATRKNPRRTSSSSLSTPRTPQNPATTLSSLCLHSSQPAKPLDEPLLPLSTLLATRKNPRRTSSSSVYTPCNPQKPHPT